MPDEPNDNIAKDRLRGAQAIADFIGENLSITYHGLENGFVPATKQGRIWIGSKAVLQEHFRKPTNLPPPATSPPTADTSPPAPVMRRPTRSQLSSPPKVKEPRRNDRRRR
jgi:hypothetical protein